MIRKHYLNVIGCLVAFIATTSYSMVFDNRYFPLYPKPFIRDPQKPSLLAVQPLFMYADRSFGYYKEIGLPEINGSFDEINAETDPAYDQAEIARALVLSRRVAQNPLRSDLRGRIIPWDREGFMIAQGVAFYYEQALNCYWSLGFTGLFLHYNSNHEFFFYDSCLGAPNIGQRAYLYNLKARMHEELGVTPAIYEDINIGDMDFYIRLSNFWEYACRCRLINAGINVGGIAPTAPTRNINNPASLPMGGDGHWGAYVQGDAQFELREDLIIGGLARVIKRFKNTRCHRMPVLEEPSLYGAVQGLAEVNPGVTFAFAPYGKIAGLNGACGIGIGYTLVAHQPDAWTDMRSDKTIPVNLEPVVKQSRWRSEHITISAFCDYSKYRCDANIAPTLTVAWDIPTNLTVANQVYKTSCVSLIMHVNF